MDEQIVDDLQSHVNGLRAQNKEPRWIILDMVTCNEISGSKHFTEAFEQTDIKKGDTLFGIRVALVTPPGRDRYMEIIR